MAKGDKRVAAESNRKSRYETEGYKRSEQRKKITRRINRLNNEIANGKITGANNIANANKLISNLEKMKQETYINKETGKYKYVKEHVENVLKYASRGRERISLDVETPRKGDEEKRQIRLNKLFEQEINQASLSSDVGVSSLTKPEVKIFYAATMEAWQGKSAEYRNLYIMQSLGVKSLEEAFRIVMSRDTSQEALKRAGKELEIEVEKSPDYIDYLLSMIDV